MGALGNASEYRLHPAALVSLLSPATCNSVWASRSLPAKIRAEQALIGT